MPAFDEISSVLVAVESVGASNKNALNFMTKDRNIDHQHINRD